MSKIIIITTPGCAPCEQLKRSKILDSEGNIIKPEILDIQTSDKAVEIIEKTNIMSAPAAFEETDSGYKACDLKISNKNEVVVICDE